MPRPIVPALLLTLLAPAFAPLSGCSSGIHGVEISNSTDRVVRVELLLLKKDGELSVYSTQTLSPGGDFKHKVDDDDRRPGMRVRMTLADQTLSDSNWVMLNLPTNHDRAYDLEIVGNQLTAKETTRKPRNRSTVRADRSG